MPQFERRLYEPSDDMRAFDASEDDLEEEGSRLPLLIVIALVVLASFAGVVWLAYTQGVQRGRESTPRVIAAQPAKKTANTEKNPYAGLDIYKPSKPGEAGQDDTPVLPTVVPSKPAVAVPSMKSALPGAQGTATQAVTASKSAVAKPAAVVPDKIASSPAVEHGAKPISPATKQMATPVAGKPTPVKPYVARPKKFVQQSTTPSTSRTAPSQMGARVATAAPRIIAPPATLKPAPKPAAPITKPASATSKPTNIATNPAPAVAPMATPARDMAALNPPAPVKSTTAAPVQAVPASSGGFLLQIGSYKSEAEATASWQTYKSAHPVVSGYAADIHRAELGAKGTWYRLRVGPFASLSEANAACAKVKASGGNCFPAKR